MRILPFIILLLLAGLSEARAWDEEGHRAISRLALAALPAGFPLVREPGNAARIQYFSSAPDRWRNVDDPTLRGTASPEHFINLEELPQYGLRAESLPPERYAYAARISAAAGGRAKSGQVDWPGFLPWALVERYQLLRSAFSVWRTYGSMGGTPEEVATAAQEAIQAMGILGHFVGDAAQPLHTTIHFNGWSGANPQGYSTAATLHSWIDGGFLRKARIDPDALAGTMAPARRVGSGTPDGAAVFSAAMEFVRRQHGRVELLYRLEKQGRFNRDERPAHAEGRAFLEQQLKDGAALLASLWLTAWQTAPRDTFLEAELRRRKE